MIAAYITGHYWTLLVFGLACAYLGALLGVAVTSLCHAARIGGKVYHHAESHPPYIDNVRLVQETRKANERREAEELRKARLQPPVRAEVSKHEPPKGEAHAL